MLTIRSTKKQQPMSASVWSTKGSIYLGPTSRPERNMTFCERSKSTKPLLNMRAWIRLFHRKGQWKFCSFHFSAYWSDPLSSMWKIPLWVLLIRNLAWASGLVFPRGITLSILCICQRVWVVKLLTMVCIGLIWLYWEKRSNFSRRMDSPRSLARKHFSLQAASLFPILNTHGGVEKNTTKE